MHAAHIHETTAGPLLPRRAPRRPLQLEGGRHSSLTQFLPADSGPPKRKVMGLPVSGRTAFMAEGRKAQNGIDQYTPSLQWIQSSGPEWGYVIFALLHR